MIGDRYIQSPLMSYVRCRGSVRQALDMAKNRLAIAGGALGVLLVCILIRLFDVTIFQGDERYVIDPDQKGGLQTARANIIDRNGALLATTIRTGSLSANAKVIHNPHEVATKLSPILELREDLLLKRLSSKRRFIWLKRHLTPKQQKQVIQLGIPGLEIIRDERRVYPHGVLTGHVIGMTDIDNQGISGLEASLDHRLRTETGNVQLSLDIRVQNVLFDVLQKAMKTYQARAVNGLILDLQTGEILAMVSFPEVNPNRPQEVDYAKLFDRNVAGVYELGSVFKIMNTALALEKSKVPIHKQYDATKPLKIGRFQVTDVAAKNRWMSITDILRYSSNIGSGLMALEAGIDTQREFLRDLGLLSPLAIELPGAGKPQFPKHWSEANAITISYGYGISVSPLRFAAATAALLNRGIPVQPTLLKEQGKAIISGKRLVSAKTSAQLRALLRYTATEGTAKKADLPGYVVLGKTGTAMQLVNGKYKSGVLTTSFVGSIGRTLNKPEYLVMVTLDRPKGTKKTWGLRGAGWNAAPTAREVMARLVNVLGLEPSSSVDKDVGHDISTLVRLASLEVNSYGA